METPPAISPVRPRPRPPARRGRGQAKPAAPGTAAPAADGFLKFRFAPLYHCAPDLPEAGAAEKEFFSSLEHLQQHYGLGMPEHSVQAYPYNILLALHHLRRALRRADRFRELQVLQSEAGQIFLQVKESLKWNLSLYYIPVQPLYVLWQQPAMLPCARLLTSVFAWLRAGAGLSYYREEGTYMHGNYQLLEEWLSEAGDEEAAGLLAEIRQGSAQGDYILAQMQSADLRELPAVLLPDFSPESAFQKDCLTLAQAFATLNQDFPGAHLLQHANPGGALAGDDDGDYIALPDYVAFIASTEGDLSGELLEIVNTDFNECSAFQEPEIQTSFERPQPPYADPLAFEHRLLQLIDNLCTLLNQIPCQN